jgi:hypothetical protein
MALTTIQNGMIGNSTQLALNPGVPIVETTQTISTSYTITSGCSAMSVGPITISSGVSVTISPGSRWAIL